MGFVSIINGNTALIHTTYFILSFNSYDNNKKYIHTPHAVTEIYLT